MAIRTITHSREILSVILGGGAGSRLYPLTASRSKPAVPIAGKYRLVDIPISNCLNNGIGRMFVLTQYNSASLNRHIKNTYHFSAFSKAFVDILAAEQTPDNPAWYQGTADAVRQGLRHIEPFDSDYILILSGDQLYQMDFAEMLDNHKSLGADISVATIPVAQREAPEFGILKSDSGLITSFVEKPKKEMLEDWVSDTGDEMKAAGRVYLASMGIYIFNTETLLKALIADAEDPDSKHDFGHNILPNLLGKKKMMAYSFVDENKKQALYWRDVGTLDAYYEANMDLCSVSPIFNLYDKSWPIRTRVRQYPPAKFVFGEPGRSGMAVNSIITAGVIISGASVYNSVLSQDVRVNSYSDVDASIIFSHVNIGRHCRIRRAIIDRDVHIPEGTVIGYDQAEDKRRYFVTPSGLTIVTRDASMFENPVAPEFMERY